MEADGQGACSQPATGEAGARQKPHLAGDERLRRAIDNSRCGASAVGGTDDGDCPVGVAVLGGGEMFAGSVTIGVMVTNGTPVVSVANALPGGP
jgi:hypothetical protein